MSRKFLKQQHAHTVIAHFHTDQKVHCTLLKKDANFTQRTSIRTKTCQQTNGQRQINSHKHKTANPGSAQHKKRLTDSPNEMKVMFSWFDLAPQAIYNYGNCDKSTCTSNSFSVSWQLCITNMSPGHVGIARASCFGLIQPLIKTNQKHNFP